MPVPLVTVTPVAAVPPKLTEAPDAKLLPAMVTEVPPATGPLTGFTEPTEGAVLFAGALKVATCITQAPAEVSGALAL